MVTALKVDAVDAALPDKIEGKASLYRVGLPNGKATQVTDDAAFAVYSPKGTKVLIGSSSDKDGAITLSMAPSDGSAVKAIVTDAAKQAGSGMGEQSSIYPTWLDDETVLYVSQQVVYGTTGKNLMLTSVRADGENVKLHQSAIETGLRNK
jgi:hypothetical protein